MVVKIVGVEGGVAEGRKAWDEAATGVGAGSPGTRFFAKMVYHGQSGTPSDGELKVGQYAVFQRVGEFNSTGTNGFEFRAENEDRTSWITFVTPQIIFIEDLGWLDEPEIRQGREVIFLENQTSLVPPGAETLQLKTLDPSSFYYTIPPYQTGRIYWGLKVGGPTPYYLVFLPAKGDLAKTFTQSKSGTTWTLKVDGSGHVLDFTVV